MTEHVLARRPAEEEADVSAVSRAATISRPAKSAVVAITTLLTRTGGVLLLVLMFLTVADVTSRALAGHSLPGVIEFTEVALVAVAFLGMAGAEMSGQHIRSALVVSRMGPRAAWTLRAIGIAIAMLTLAWLIWATMDSALASVQAREVRHGMTNIPVWPAKLAVGVGLAAFLAVMVVNSRRLVRGLVYDYEDDDREPEGLESTEPGAWT